MPTLPDIISDVEYGRQALLEAIDGLTERELVELEVYPGWTIKDILAHVAGWNRRAINNLALIRQGRANEISPIDPEAYNQQSVAERKNLSLREILAEIDASHRQFLIMLNKLDYHDIDRRYERSGKYITIRSYVIDKMVEHERQHAAELHLWRESLSRK